MEMMKHSYANLVCSNLDRFVQYGYFLPVFTHTHGMLGNVFPKLSGYRLKTLPNRRFTVVCLVALSLNESEAGDEFVLKETSQQNSIINKRKAERFFFKTSSSPASLSFKGQATKHTIVKWSILQFALVCMYFLFFHFNFNFKHQNCFRH